MKRIILFTRFPEPGSTKTRLIEKLGPEGAAGLQQQMTEWIAAEIAGLQGSGAITAEIHYEGGDAAKMAQWLGPRFIYRKQEGGDLGRRMAIAFRSAFADHMQQVVIMGSDCPAITAAVIDKALRKLTECDLVLGPTFDGGYYLIGLNRMEESLFQGIDWGTKEVLAQTVERAGQANLAVCLLEKLHDVDRPEDLDIPELPL